MQEIKGVDSELYYVNHEGVPPQVATQIQKNSSRTLKNVREYLARAKKAKEKMQFRVKWKVSERKENGFNEGYSKLEGEQVLNDYAIWIELLEHPEDNPEKIESTFKAFFDAKSIQQTQKASDAKPI